MKQSALYNEKELLNRISQGDESAFVVFFDLYKNRFFAVAYKMTRSREVAEEMVQEIFLGIWQKKELLPDIENPSTYFFTALYRKVFTYYRKLARERKLIEAASLDVSEFENTTDLTILSRDQARIINEAIAQLPPQQQLVFRLSKQDGLSRQEVADQLKISPNTVKNHLANAIKFLETYLKNPSLIFFLFQFILKK